jgi:hypothetical protein
MKRIPIIALFALSTTLRAEPALTEEDRTALEIGRAFLKVERALEYKLPESPSPEDVAKSEKLTREMIDAGQLTRLYPWVRARIDMEITLTESLLRDTRPDAARMRELNARIKYLQRVRYLIDAPQ